MPADLHSLPTTNLTPCFPNEFRDDPSSSSGAFANPMRMRTAWI